MPRQNILVALGGGPSPVINASLQGVLESCLDRPDAFDRVYCAAHGIEGVLLEELIDMKQESREEIARLRNTPSSGAIGTCRYKLKDGNEEDYIRVLDVFQRHGITGFVYIGGNDSMDTADQINKLAKARDMELTVAGVPKTIDNDVGDEAFTIIDHTPGYGSAARYWANIIMEAEEENRGMCVSERVCVLQAMGRRSGYITAAARLADPERNIPLQMYFAESGHTLSSLTDHVNDELKRSGRCIVVVNEGFDTGDLGERKDGFGHTEYGASRSTAAQNVINHLNHVGLAARGNAVGQVPGILQRSCSLHRSAVDAREAYEAGAHAVKLILDGQSGYMATILRKKTEAYGVYYDQVTLSAVANSERFLPKSWIAPNGLDVTDDFIKYAKPLIGEGVAPFEYENGILRFARIQRRLLEKRCPPYVPQNHRG
ncbi:MAG TPA: diphosphate--fructose-6-phosphate 1-phosphotransferase [Feifaniaceae bacterium]|nr:diphosphate--fructose-6-phosphate 1-phosphotransferase [Feifaniaceae bacterium]